MSKIGYFHYVKNKIDTLRHLAFMQYENRNAVAYDCRDVAVILRQLKFKKSQIPIPSIKNEKKFSNRCLFLKAKGKKKSNHEDLDRWQRSLRLQDVIDF